MMREIASEEKYVSPRARTRPELSAMSTGDPAANVPSTRVIPTGRSALVEYKGALPAARVHEPHESRPPATRGARRKERAEIFACENGIESRGKCENARGSRNGGVMHGRKLRHHPTGSDGRPA